MRVARRAGTQQASRATAASSRGITTNVSGSVALTPKSRPWINRVRANDAPTPIARPMMVHVEQRGRHKRSLSQAAHLRGGRAGRDVRELDLLVAN